MSRRRNQSKSEIRSPKSERNPKSEVRSPKDQRLAEGPFGLRTSDFGFRISDFRSLTLRNQQRTRRVNTARLRQIARTLLQELLQLERFELGIYLVGAPEMTRLNETFLRHRGSTDVIAFDYREPAPSGWVERRAPARRSASAAGPLSGEIFVCVDEALVQARRFRTTWQSELVRYVVHGVLHLCGYDDQSPAARRKMKREEVRLLAQLAVRFPLRRLAERLRPPVL